jgi:limonene-1,2-epoxide hydrolase
MSNAQNLEIAHAWLDAFNARDVDRLVSLYSETATHTSPKIRVLHPETAGCLVGKAALSQWWKAANARLPGLRYELVALTADDSRVFMEYLRHAPGEAPMPVAEVLEVQAGKIVASRVYHG